MNPTRRTFLRGAASLLLLPVIPKTLPITPTIYGDGIHDDWAGMQAMVNGEAFNIESTSGTLVDGVLSGANLRLSQTLTFTRDAPPLVMRKVIMTFLPELSGAPSIVCKTKVPVVFEDCSFNVLDVVAGQRFMVLS